MIEIKCKSIAHSLFPNELDIVVSMANGKPRSMTVNAKLIDETKQTVKASIVRPIPDRYETYHVNVGNEMFYIRSEVLQS